MGRDEDAGLAALAARSLLKSVRDLRKEEEGVRRAEDPEAVHRMRVASRRLRAGMELFSSCMPRKRAKRWMKAVRGVTGALGEARDCDVQVEFLGQLLVRVDAPSRPGVEAVLELKRARREGLQAGAVRWLDELEESGAAAEMEAFLAGERDRMEGTEARTAGAYAHGWAHVAARTDGLLALEGCVHDPGAIEAHHRMRIAAKRLRYTAEAFRPLFDDQLKAELGRLKELQDVLGEMHDCDVWAGEGPALLAALPQPALARGIEALLEDRRLRRDELYRRFAAMWPELRWEDAFGELEERFRAARGPGEHPALAVGPDAPWVAVISDVHGNLHALRAVLADARERRAGAVLDLGDAVGYGAFPEEVVHLLRREGALSVRGNFDRNIVEASRAGGPEGRGAKAAVVRAAAEDLSPGSVEMLASLPPQRRLEMRGRRILMVHASPADDDEHLGPDTPKARLRELAAAADADVVLTGHSHLPYARRAGGTLFINPGSVGRPADGDARASYALLRSGDLAVELVRVEYDVEGAARAVLRRGLPGEVAELFRQGLSSQEGLGKEADRLRQVNGTAARLNVDHRHARQVLRLARTLFRDLRPVHGLERPDRFLLEAACLLHDVGLSEGAEGHHRASRRLIMGLDVPLDERERRMVAAVARYHRGRLPRPGDRALEGLSPPDRDRVLRLAALLRVADGLDYGHAGAVKGLRATVEGDAAVLTVEADERPEAEIAAARRKSDLFEEVFALPVVVR